VAQARAAAWLKLEDRWAFEGTRSVGLALSGQAVQAQRVASAARQVAGSEPHQTLESELALAEALVARERGDRAGARAGLERLAASERAMDDLQLVAGLELVELELSAGLLSAATARFSEVLSLQEGLPLLSAPETPGGDAGSVEDGAGASLAAWVARVGVEVSLATDDLDSAARWTGRTVDRFWRPLCEAKVELAPGRPEEAGAALGAGQPRCQRHEVVADLVLARVVAARERDAAGAAVARAMTVAARLGMLQSVAAHGAPVMELVELQAWCVPEAWMDRLRHTLLPVWAGRDVQGPVENLTDREREVLRLLPSRLTVREIAAELYVSPNTLKFHLRAIYRKLGVASRTDAVDAARQMRLLPGGKRLGEGAAG
jgi:LuxR family maltose regulon positive regulatory protein